MKKWNETQGLGESIVAEYRSQLDMIDFNV